MPFTSFSPPRETLLSKASLASGRRLGYFLAAVGIVCLGVADYLFCRERIFLAHAGRSTGHVVELQEQRTRLGLRYAPVFAYTDTTGRERRFVSGGSVNQAAFTVGESAQVFYRLDRPAEGQLDGFFTRWGVSLVFGVTGAVFTLVGYVGTGVFEWLQRTSHFP